MNDNDELEWMIASSETTHRRQDHHAKKQHRRSLAGYIMLAAMNFGLLLALYSQVRQNSNNDATYSSDSFFTVSACAVAPHRCTSIDLSKQFSFVHISKCAGSSWIHEMKHIFPNFFPTEEDGIEWSVAYQQREHPSDYLAISLKSPRHHVWSLFTECKYDGWGMKVTKNSAFQRSGNTTDSDLVDFNHWLSYFVARLPDPTRDCYNCYNPSNFMSQHLASSEKSPRCKPQTVSPSLVVANQTLQDLDFVAVVEFYHESKCLLFHRMILEEQDDDSQETSTLQTYLDTECRCPLPPTTSDTHQTHHKLGHRAILRDLPKETLRAIEWLTHVDSEIYRIALDQFLREIVWLETKLGRRVLCDSSLSKWELELEYLGVSLTKKYQKLLGM